MAFITPAAVDICVLGAKVEREKGEMLRRELTSAGLVDNSVAIVDEDGSVIVPLLSRPDDALIARTGAILVERAFPPRKSRRDPIDEIREICSIPECLKSQLPDKWELLGDVLVIRLDKRLHKHRKQIAETYARVLRAKSVLQDVGGVRGELRTPTMRRLFGTDTVTSHIENGIVYRFDAERIMFSSGNMEERLRMAHVECDGETILDMFAGIGYFSLPLAVYQRPKKVIACELNPIAFSYLEQNIAINKVSHVVEPVLGDNRSLPGEEVADRIIMGYVKTTHEYLSTAMRLVKDGGIIHYHETCPLELLPERPVQRIRSEARGYAVDVLRLKEIKSYSPGISHVVVDARIRKSS